jgi:ATP-binding cassette subfamily B (MDR/TAP) protein 1
MNAKGLYYHLVESQEHNSTPDEVDDSQISNLEPREGGMTTNEDLSGINPRTLPQIEEKLNKSIQKALPLQSANKDTDVSMWKILKLNKPEWEYITLGVIGSAILGMSTPVYAMVYGELMGLLDPALPEDEAQQLNNTLALVHDIFLKLFVLKKC